MPAQQVNSIERVDGHRVYHVRANVKRMRRWHHANCVESPAQDQDMDRDADTSRTTCACQFKGATSSRTNPARSWSMAAFLALFLIAIVLLALFNSFYHAGLILVAVILAMIGALLGMVVMGQTFSIIMTGTGMLALAGIVVNHNIVLIDTFHRLRDAGMDPIEAVIRSSAQRLRPVFLTTITAIGGLLPMMFAHRDQFRDARSHASAARTRSMWIQLSTAIVFGLAFSKLITLGLVPAMLALPYRLRESASRGARRREGGVCTSLASAAGQSAATEAAAGRRIINPASTGTARAMPGATSGSFSTALSFSRAAAASFCLFHIAA